MAVTEAGSDDFASKNPRTLLNLTVPENGGGQIRYFRLDLDQSSLDHGGDVETMSANR